MVKKKRESTKLDGQFAGIDDFCNSLEKKYGSIMLNTEEKDTNVKFTTTNIVSLDNILGGGLPQGRIIEIFGPESSGKSTLALHCIGVAQKLGGAACLVDAEYAYDKDYATHIGVDTNSLKIVQPENAQQGLGAVEEMVLSNLFDIIVVDSVAALVPKEEVEGEMGDSHMGLQARLMSQALRKLSGIVSKSKCRLIFINQIRMKIGIMFGNPETTTGGNALKFYSSIRLDVRKIEFLGLKERPTGIRQKVKCVKNKVAPPFRQTELNLYFNTGYDIASDVFEYADSFGIISHEGRSMLFNGERIGVNDAECITNIRNNKELRVNLKKQVKESFLKQG